MLTLTRREQETITIGDNITIYVTQTSQNKVKLSIEAPKEIQILRGNTKCRRPKG